jgi:hypothetical protein
MKSLDRDACEMCKNKMLKSKTVSFQFIERPTYLNETSENSKILVSIRNVSYKEQIRLLVENLLNHNKESLLLRSYSF